MSHHELMRSGLTAAQERDEYGSFFLLWCKVCKPVPEPGNAIPFDSAADRGKWAGAHTRGTGHDSWLVLDMPSRAEGGES